MGLAPGLRVSSSTLVKCGSPPIISNRPRPSSGSDLKRWRPFAPAVIALLAATLTRDELLTLPADQVLHRLFWQEQVTRFAPRAPRFACRCSSERVRGMLRTLGREESDSLIAERGLVEVGCDFCGRHYRFDAVDVGEMFTPQANQPPASEAVQ